MFYATEQLYYPMRMMTYWPTTISITVTRNCLGKILCTYIKQLDLSLNRVCTYVSRDKIKWFWNDNAIVNVKSRPTDISIVHIILLLLLLSSLPTYYIIVMYYILVTRVTNVSRDIFFECVCVCVRVCFSGLLSDMKTIFCIISIYTGSWTWYWTSSNGYDFHFFIDTL